MDGCGDIEPEAIGSSQGASGVWCLPPFPCCEHGHPVCQVVGFIQDPVDGQPQLTKALVNGAPGPANKSAVRAVLAAGFVSPLRGAR